MPESSRLNIAELAAEIAAARSRTSELMARMAKEPDTPLLPVAIEELQTELEVLRVAEEELRAQADELAAATETIAQERERFRTLFDLAPDAYLETDRTGMILSANQAAGRLFGSHAARLPGRALVTFAPLSRRGDMRTSMHKAVEQGMRLEFRSELEPRNGDPFPAVVTAEPGVGEEGLPVVRWIVRDISESLVMAERMAALEAEVELLNRLQDLSATLLSERPLEDALNRLVALAVESFPGSQVSVTLRTDGRLETPTASDPVAVELDKAQHELDEGPCVDAVRSGVPQRIAESSVDGDRQWPRFTALTAARGIESVLAQPLMAGGEAIGALNFYCPEPGAFAAEHDRKLVLLAEQGAFAIANTRLYASAALLAEQLNQALQSRPIIEQAKGILMAREGCDEDRAFDMLRRASQRTNRKLREIAHQVVEGAAGTDDPADHRE
jgi:PAS domain S-box-containing protein